jgi:hypothetical protein
MASTSSEESRSPLAAVRTGMRVLDSTGEQIGTVEDVKMADPRAFTADRQAVGEVDTFLEHLVQSVTGPEPDVPPGLAATLLRVGYLKVDGPGLADTDRYVAANDIADITDSVVRLAVPRNRTVTET